MTFDVRNLTGWVENKPAIQETVAEHGELRRVASNLIGAEQKDVFLWRPLLKVKPTWRRKAQKIGDCSRKGALIALKDGTLKAIETIKIGEEVISGNGNARAVTNIVHKPVADYNMVELQLRGSLRPLHLTVDHLLPCITPEGEYLWIPAGEMTTKHTLLFGVGVDESHTVAPTFDMADFCQDPITDETPNNVKVAGLQEPRRFVPVTPGRVRDKGAGTECNRFVQMDERLAWLIGLYAAEGSLDKSASGHPRRITFNLGRHRMRDACKAARYITEIFGIDAEVVHVPSKPSVLYVRVCGKIVPNFFSEMVSGNVYVKALKPLLHNLPLELRKSLLRGWFDGDGHVSLKEKGCGSTSSRALFEDMRRLFHSCGMAISCSVIPAKPGHKEAYSISIRKDQLQTIYPFGDYPPIAHKDGTVTFWQPRQPETQPAPAATNVAVAEEAPIGAPSAITAIRYYTLHDQVYCLEVAEDHSFLAEGVVISNCVSWGCEIAMTLLMALQDVIGEGQFIEEAATEAIYGGARVEVTGRQGGYEDGAVGAYAAKWVNKWGVILRLDYSKDTGNPDHNLTKYSGDKAKDWGNFGCGGRNDKGALDNIAKKFPCSHIAQVTTIPEAIAALSNGYPVTIASNAGFGDMRRDSTGVCRWTNSWGHLMCLWGLRWVSGHPQFRICQSWGDVCSGPDPGILESISDIWKPEVSAVGSESSGLLLPHADFPYQTDPTSDPWNPVSATSWWATEADIARILQSGDCWTYSGVQGFVKRNIDFAKGFSTW